MPTYHHYGFDSPSGIDPSPLLASLRRGEPVARVITPYGDASWLVTRYASVKAVLRDHRLSRAGALALGERVPRVSEYVTDVNYLSRFDPPEHSRLRLLVSGPLAKREVERHRPRAKEIANDVIDDLVSSGRPADLVSGFAKPFPMISLGEFIGVPAAERGESLVVARPAIYRRDTTESAQVAESSRQKQRVHELLASRRERPRNDLMTAFVRAQEDGNRYTDQEILAVAGDLMTNGSVGVYLATVLYALLTHPDQLGWLRANPDRLPQAVEEVMRFVPLAPEAPSGAQGHVRLALQDLEIDGITVRAGEWVLPSTNSANRDERIFTDPHRLDLRRVPNPHVAFGVGIHRCPGAALTRMQLQVAIGTLLTRFPRLSLAVPEREVVWQAGLAARTPERLPATW